jgi:bifunctional DNase/RNase
MHLVVLREHGGTRALPIFIGEPEGRAMAASLTGLQSPRPMTYQMTASLVAALSGSVTEVRVMRLSENTFIAEVVVDGPSGPKVIDARPSDAINLALLTGAPVRASSELLEQLAPTYEQFDLDAYPDDANIIRAELGSLALRPSLERLTSDAMEVFVEAGEEAYRRRHAAVGTGHILLALLRSGGATGLEGFGVPISAAEGALDTEVSVPSQAPFRLLRHVPAKSCDHGDNEVNPITSTAAFTHFQLGHAERPSGNVNQQDSRPHRCLHHDNRLTALVYNLPTGPTPSASPAGDQVPDALVPALN